MISDDIVVKEVLYVKVNVVLDDFVSMGKWR